MGKTSSLKYFPDHSRVLYLNCEGKPLPFKNNFREKKITDPKVIPLLINKVETNPDIDTVIVDTITYMMARYESVYVNTSANSQKEWGNYYEYFSNLLLDTCVKSSKNIIMLGHTVDIYNEESMTMDTQVKVKGALMNQGIESFFTDVLTAKRVSISELEGIENDLLHITDEEREDEFKYVFQTRLTKKTRGERIRSTDGMWARNELYIDNNINQVIERMNQFHNGEAA